VDFGQATVESVVSFAASESSRFSLPDPMQAIHESATSSLNIALHLAAISFR
jgi:hypothetical protein